MAIASFRFPGPDLHHSSETFLNETNAVIHERAPEHLTAQDIQRIHRPLEQVHQDVIQVSFLIDDVGLNEGARPDHALLGQAATAGLMRMLDLLLEMLGRMPDQNVIDIVVSNDDYGKEGIPSDG
jgi:hypothetical protein